MEMLRRTHADLATINLVENALAQRHPVMIDIDLADEQFAAIQRREQ